MSKTRMSVRIASIAGVAVMAAWLLGAAQTLSVPPGFRMDAIVEDLRGVRTLKFGPDGMLYAVQSRDGRVVRFDPSGRDRAEPVVSGLNRPYGLAFHDGWMYVGETDAIIRLRGPEYQTRETIVDGIPSGGHWTREIAFGPDGMLYVSVGSSCNVCEESDPRRAAVVRYRPDGGDETIVAEGLRNAAGLAFHPQTGALWASQNERDNLGDDLPLEEINILSDGDHFGWPYCYGDRRPNPEYSDRTNFCAGRLLRPLG